MNSQEHEYRTRLRKFPCRYCGASPGTPCMTNARDPGLVSSEAPYEHADRTWQSVVSARAKDKQAREMPRWFTRDDVHKERVLAKLDYIIDMLERGR